MFQLICSHWPWENSRCLLPKINPVILAAFIVFLSCLKDPTSWRPAIFDFSSQSFPSEINRISASFPNFRGPQVDQTNYKSVRFGNSDKSKHRSVQRVSDLFWQLPGFPEKCCRQICWLNQTLNAVVTTFVVYNRRSTSRIIYTFNDL